MVFAEEATRGSEGGRYGSVGESGAVMSGSSSSSSSSSIIIEDGDDSGLMSHDVYQRQPLIPNHDTFVKANGVCSEGSNSFFDGSIGNGIVKISIPSPHREEPRFPKEKLKTLVAFIFLLFNWFITCMALSTVHEKVPQTDPLPDVILDSIRYQKWGLEVSEILIVVITYICIMVVIFHKHRFILFRRIFLMLGLLYFYRSITLYVTALPVADTTYYCSPKANSTNFILMLKRSVQLLSGFGLAMNGRHTFCGDYIYSGHTVILVMACLIVREYTPRRWWPLHWLFIVLASVGVVMVLISRGHYTVDCVIAYYITTRIFYMYHTMANNQNLKVNGPSNFFERLWWYPLFQYFECNVQGVVPRHYEWPLPWPRRWSSKSPQRTS